MDLKYHVWIWLKYVRIKATQDNEEKAAQFIDYALNIAENNGVVLLIETVGVYSDTAKLRSFLNNYASDYLCALWDLHYPYRVCGESPEKTVWIM